MVNNGFPKSEHLCGSLCIASLYKTGHRFVSFPLRVTWRKVDSGDVPVQVLVWAPKALFKHATDRNRKRRLMREAYRLEKAPLVEYCEEKDCTIELAFNYISKEDRSLDDLRKAVRKAIEKILKQ